MRLHSPSSFGYFRVRFSPFDVIWAAAAPFLGLYLRDAYVLTPEHALTPLLYGGASFMFAILAFAMFRLGDGMSRHFSVHDALNVIKASVAAQLLTSVFLFSFTRLDGIPRTTPIVHLLVLVTGLLAARVMVLLFNPDRKVTAVPKYVALEHAIIIGSTDLSGLYIKFIRAYASGHRRIVALLDSDPRLIGRAVAGVPIIAAPQNLEAVIDEFTVHGIRIDRIMIGGGRDLLPKAALNEIRRICDRRELKLDFVAELVGLNDAPLLSPSQTRTTASVPAMVHPRRPATILPPYFQFKRMVDFFCALAAIVILSPLFIFAALLVLIDVGSPVLFWQQRIGQNASSILLYKFRTLHSPFDSHGNRVPDEQRMSWVGVLMRKLRLDELPQLFNVLVGDMSMIGPRPLLPEDQPANAGLRLTVRPGITGWAQINGGNLITAEEKGALDEWYIRHASLWLDLHIVALTIRFLFTGEKRSEAAVDAACAAQRGKFRENATPQVRKFRDAVSRRASTMAIAPNFDHEPEPRPAKPARPHQ